MPPADLPISRRAWFYVPLIAAGIYLLWNVWWLAHARVPPSMLTWASGIPSPTTGGTRAFRALMRGDFVVSLQYNPMTLPILGIIAFSLASIVRRRFQRKSIVFPPALSWSWGVILLLAWAIQLSHWAIS